MIESFLLVGQQVLTLFLLGAVGFAVGKFQWIDDHTSKGISNMVMNVVFPCIMITSFQRPLESSSLRNFGMVALLAIVMHLLGLVLAAMLLPRGEDARPLFQFGVIFSNCAFMSYPLQTAILGSIGIFYGSAYVAVYNVLSWTYGVWLLTGDKKNLSLRPILINPGVTGVIVALALYLLQISLPQFLMTPMQYISNLNTPLPMMIVGYQLSHVDLRRALQSRGCWISMLLRLIVVPLAALGLCLALQVEREVAITLVVASSAPAGAALSMFAARFDKDTDLAASVVSTHTLFSLATMPVIVGLAQYLM